MISYPNLLFFVFLLSSVQAVTHVIVEGEVISQQVNVEATVYTGSATTFTSGSSTELGASSSVGEFTTSYDTSSQTTTVAPTAAQVQATTTAQAQIQVQAQAAKPTSSAAAAATPAASAANLNEFQSVMLSEHNVKRALHQGVGALTWSNTLAQYAQNYANAYVCPAAGTLTHSGGQYGENLASGYTDKGTVDAWYDEIKQYNFNSPGFNEATGHFTQLIWKASQQLGCAKKDCNNEWGTYIVCEYYPMGNIVVSGDSSYWSGNVPPLK